MHGCRLCLAHRYSRTPLQKNKLDKGAATDDRMHFADAVLAALVAAAGTLHWKETCVVVLVVLVLLQGTLVNGPPTSAPATLVDAPDAEERAPSVSVLQSDDEEMHARAHRLRNIDAHPRAKHVDRFMAAAVLDFERDNHRTDPHVRRSRERRAT